MVHDTLCFAYHFLPVGKSTLVRVSRESHCSQPPHGILCLGVGERFADGLEKWLCTKLSLGDEARLYVVEGRGVTYEVKS